MQPSYVVKLVLKPVTAINGCNLDRLNCRAQVEQVVSTAQFGDLVEFTYPVGYSHWGVYDGDGYIIHFAVAGKHENIHFSLNTLLFL